MMRGWIPVLLVCILLPILFSCGDDDDDSSAAAPSDTDRADDDSAADDDLPDDDAVDDDDDDSAQLPELEDLIDRMGFLPYLEVEPVEEKQSINGYTRYFFDVEDFRCFYGKRANVAVSEGTSNNVMLFLEGGGASWPGGGFCVPFDNPFDMGIKTRDPVNPVHDWNFVYVPYCDCSLHCGDNEMDFDGKVRYYHGLRHAAAAVALMKKLFPNPDKLLIAGSSAGGYGTLYAWLIAKSQYMDTDTYIFNDSGTGFWNPEDPGTFDTISSAWNLFIPEDCALCTDTAFAYIYDTYLRYDPQVRIGMFTAYYDALITGLFLDIDPEAFKTELLSVTGEIKQQHPDRFARFFIDTTTHTNYDLEWVDVFPGRDFFLDEGPNYEVDGTSLFEWLGYLVQDDADWGDLLE